MTYGGSKKSLWTDRKDTGQVLQTPTKYFLSTCFRFAYKEKYKKQVDVKS